MILGADNVFGSRKTVTIFDRITESFTDGVKMNYNRENAACTIFKSPNHGNRPVVFIGGGKEQNTAEILDYSQSGATWEEGKLKTVYIFRDTFLNFNLSRLHGLSNGPIRSLGQEYECIIYKFYMDFGCTNSCNRLLQEFFKNTN